MADSRLIYVVPPEKIVVRFQLAAAKSIVASAIQDGINTWLESGAIKSPCGNGREQAVPGTPHCMESVTM